MKKRIIHDYIVPCLLLGFILALIVLGFFIFSYVLLFMIVVGLVLFVINYIRAWFFVRKERFPVEKKQGRVIEQDKKD